MLWSEVGKSTKSFETWPLKLLYNFKQNAKVVKDFGLVAYEKFCTPPRKYIPHNICLHPQRGLFFFSWIPSSRLGGDIVLDPVKLKHFSKEVFRSPLPCTAV